MQKILFTLSIALLVWLFFGNMLQIDIAATKNEHVYFHDKLQIDSIQNIDSLKTLAKRYVDIMKRNTRNNSDIATKRFWIISGLIIIQIGITYVVYKRKAID